MRTVSTDLNILIRPEELTQAIATMPEGLKKAGYRVTEIHAQAVDLTCEPDNMLVTQFAQTKGYPPINEVLHRVVLNGESDAALKDLTQQVVKNLPKGVYWYGTSLEGSTEPGVNAACAWQHGN
ncbi:hypothetical protein [Corynebacterium gallinarum]|uniref:Uncharacterized protein n=1 Tax=Corynebacterium gallinarum TaxID=2762214 RepID=A0A8I0HC25_9CORY|nr:hypothetical protein [Corynebacterium gallinarum]MBD8028841.1 hypothetical protein [Corynebacterium gallinarum]